MTPFPYMTVTRARVTSIYRKGVIGCQQPWPTPKDRPPMAEPALAKATIFEIAKRPWGWLSTSAVFDVRVCSLGFIRASVHGGATCNRSHIDGTETSRRRRPDRRAGSAVRADPVSRKRKNKKRLARFSFFSVFLFVG